jgi:3-hydroxybutyryl-CoA dehydrogenase
MKIAIAQNTHKALTPVASAGCLIISVAQSSDFVSFTDADAFIDMEFDGLIYSPSEKPLLINETAKTIGELGIVPLKTGRFCGWPGFAERSVWDIATNTIDNSWLNEILYAIGKQYEIVADSPGLVVPRILSNIINEAFYAIDDGVSTPFEVDIAMELGTNYPIGPLAWAKKIGTKEIYDLLQQLQTSNERYSPHPNLNSTIDSWL